MPHIQHQKPYSAQHGGRFMLTWALLAVLGSKDVVDLRGSVSRGCGILQAHVWAPCDSM